MTAVSSYAMTWDAGKTNQTLFRTLGKYRYAYIFDDNHNLTVIGKYEAKNIHKGDYNSELESNRKGFNKGFDSSWGNGRYNRVGSIVSDNGQAKKANDRISNSTLRGKRQGDGSGYRKTGYNDDLHKETEDDTKYQFRQLNTDEDILSDYLTMTAVSSYAMTTILKTGILIFGLFTK